MFIQNCEHKCECASVYMPMYVCVCVLCVRVCV